MILSTYGSDVNGLVSSVNQFLSVITLLDLGVGSVVKAALYKPIARNNKEEISAVLTAANIYFKRIAIVIVFYIVILTLFFPFVITNNSLDHFSTVMLIVATSISTFGLYYFGIVNELFLNANQKGYIQISAEIVVVSLNLIFSIILIHLKLPIEIVKLISSIIFLLRPIFLAYYVNSHYEISKNVSLLKDPLPQKWSGVGQHIAYTIQNSTDIIILSLFSTLENVSVYSLYNMITTAVNMIISSFTTGLHSFFGSLLASNEFNLLNKYFSIIEWSFHMVTVFLFSMTSILIVPFIDLYTAGINDASYYVPIFALILVLSRAISALQIPYQSMIFSAGHFKETQASSYIEAGLNIFISFCLVKYFGLSGVAIGTLISVIYRIFYLVIYLSDNILFRPTHFFYKLFFEDFLISLILFLFGSYISKIYIIDSFRKWFIFSILYGIFSLTFILIVNVYFNRSKITYIINRIKTKLYK